MLTTGSDPLEVGVFVFVVVMLGRPLFVVGGEAGSFDCLPLIALDERLVDDPAFCCGLFVTSVVELVFFVVGDYVGSFVVVGGLVVFAVVVVVVPGFFVSFLADI